MGDARMNSVEKPAYPSNLYGTHTRALQQIMPHKGIFPEDRKVWAVLNDNFDFVPRVAGRTHMDYADEISQAFEINVSGLDVLIILIRHLLTLGFSVPPLANLAMLTLQENGMRDLGWVPEEDWKLKMDILKEVWPESLLNKEFFTAKGITLESLLKEPNLRPLFKHGQRSAALFGRWSIRVLCGSDQSTLIESAREMNLLNDIESWWDGKRDPAEFLQGQFVPRPFLGHNKDMLVFPGYYEYLRGLCYPTSSGPKFIRLLYEPILNADRRSFHELRNLSLIVPCIRANYETDYDPTYEIIDFKYKLCAIIRLAENDCDDDICLYDKNGNELFPDDVGQYEKKGPSPTAQPWDIETGKRFMLFYSKVEEGRIESREEFARLFPAPRTVSGAAAVTASPPLVG